MLIILSGPSGVGKSFVINELVRHSGYKFIVPYTTRDLRRNEKDGVDYYFVTKEEIKEKSLNYSKGFWCHPIDSHVYGYYDDILHHQNKKVIIHAFTDLAFEIKKKDESTILIFLSYINKQTMISRIKERTHSIESFNNRLKYSEKEIEKAHLFDYYFTSDYPPEFINRITSLFV